MLRRFRLWLVRLLSGRDHDRLRELLALLRAHAVTSYEAHGVKLQLAPPRPERSEAPEVDAPRPSRPPSDTELLFGLTEEQARREGLVT